MDITIADAVAILSDSVEGSTIHDEKHRAALRMGIEALKLVRDQRGHRWVDAPKPLPGEKKEGQ